MKKKRVIYIIMLSVVAAAMIILGLYQIMSVYQHYREDMLAYESQHLNSIVGASARGMDVLLEGYRSQAGQLSERRSFVQAEEKAQQTGSTDSLAALLSRPDLVPPQMSCSVAVYDGNGSLIAVSDPGFPRDGGDDEDLGERIFLRSGDDEAFWFIFSSSSERGFRYELAVSVQSLFSEHSRYTRIGQRGVLFLMDRNGSFFSYSSAGVSATSSVDTLVETHPSVDAVVLSDLRDMENIQFGSYKVVRYPWEAKSGKNAIANDTLMVAFPLTLSADGLIIGAAISFQEFSSFLSDVIWHSGLVILLEIGGALILLMTLAWILVASRRDTLELQVLKEKADLMEEINRQQQSLYHSERLQQLGVMTSGVVHEFNNLLTPIMGQSHLLLEQMADQADTAQFENALDIYEASENARDVLRRMSVMGKRDMGLGFHPLNLCVLLQKTMNLASMAKEPRIMQELLLPETPIYVEGNDQLLTQAFLNLCINASQAMGSEGTLTMRAETETRCGQVYARIDVMDTGPGLEEKDLSSIYEPFYTTKGQQGTGLGLTICRKILESHKGTIEAANRPEGGAVFTVRIPTCPEPTDEV